MSERVAQRNRILMLLCEREWVGLPEILDLRIASYTRRISELREQGFVIECEITRKGRTRHSRYRLVVEPKQLELIARETIYALGSRRHVVADAVRLVCDSLEQAAAPPECEWCDGFPIMCAECVQKRTAQREEIIEECIDAAVDAGPIDASCIEAIRALKATPAPAGNLKGRMPTASELGSDDWDEPAQGEKK